MLPITINGARNTQPRINTIQPLTPAWLAHAIKPLVPVRKYLKKKTRTTSADIPTMAKIICIYQWSPLSMLVSLRHSCSTYSEIDGALESYHGSLSLWVAWVSPIPGEVYYLKGIFLCSGCIGFSFTPPNISHVSWVGCAHWVVHPVRNIAIQRVEAMVFFWNYLVNAIALLVSSQSSSFSGHSPSLSGSIINRSSLVNWAKKWPSIGW